MVEEFEVEAVKEVEPEHGRLGKLVDLFFLHGLEQYPVLVVDVDLVEGDSLVPAFLIGVNVGDR